MCENVCSNIMLYGPNEVRTVQHGVRTHNIFVWPKLGIDKNITVCHYNFTPPEVLTRITSPKGGKDATG